MLAFLLIALCLAESPAPAPSPAGFGAAVAYHEPAPRLEPGIAGAVPLEEAANLEAIETAYHLKLSAAERAFLAQHSFLVKELPATSIRPQLENQEWGREMAGLYAAVSGDPDAHGRAPQNAVFYSADAFMNLYSILFVEVLKELEDSRFVPALKTLTHELYLEAGRRQAAASTPAEKETWTQVRNYLAVPRALLGTAGDGLDTVDKVVALVRTYRLDPRSEAAVIADVRHVLAAEGRTPPEVLRTEFAEYTARTQVAFALDWTLFAPRSHYTSNGTRRQYFRALSWYAQVPFFAGSDALTDEAFALTDILTAHAETRRAYTELQDALTFLVGARDDLGPLDYVRALERSRIAANPVVERRTSVAQMAPPRIKGLPAGYGSHGTQSSADVVAKTKGMRFLGGRFLLDAYWTGQLSQGDEAPRAGYPARLPSLVSSLEVMGLLGSGYARQQVRALDFAQGPAGAAIDQAMGELDKETAALEPSFWRRDLGSVALWSLRGYFEWAEAHRAALPAFMRQAEWNAKALMTGSAFWTEQRHATLLYAKQSFAEMGAGDECDPRPIPSPPRGYIEPAPVLYARLLYLARRLDAGLAERKYDLRTVAALQQYESLLQTVVAEVDEELANAAFTEKVTKHVDEDPDQPGGKCTWYEVPTDSRWERLRLLSAQLAAALPQPVEGPVLSVKDKRIALVADVHTAGEVNQVVYEGVGAPKVILVAVKDANGARVTIGFTYSHYELREPAGGPRLTDEQWQAHFYRPAAATTADPYPDAFQYTDPKTWPAAPAWYDPILKIR